MSKLRSFKAFTNVAPVSPLVLIDAVGTVTEAIVHPCTLVNLDGAAAAAGWFQIFDLAVAPTTGVTVPLKSFNVAAAGPLPSLSMLIGPVVLSKGLYCAMSSTEAVYTAVATNFDVWGEVGEWEGMQLTGTSVTGDLTTGVDSLQVWSEATGATTAKKLFRVDVINGLVGAPVYLQVFATNLASLVQNVTKPITSQLIANVAAQQRFIFGYGGIDVFTQDANFTQRRGCTVALGLAARVYSPSGDTLNKIRALYI